MLGTPVIVLYSMLYDALDLQFLVLPLSSSLDRLSHEEEQNHSLLKLTRCGAMASSSYENDVDTMSSHIRMIL